MLTLRERKFLERYRRNEGYSIGDALRYGVTREESEAFEPHVGWLFWLAVVGLVLAIAAVVVTR